MISDTDSSDSDDFLKPNGFVDVDEKVVDLDIPLGEKDGESFSSQSSQKKRRKKKGQSTTSFDSLDTSVNVDSPCPTPSPAVITGLDESFIFIETDETTGSRQSKRTTRCSSTESFSEGPRKSRRIAAKSASFNCDDLNKSSCLVISPETSPSNSPKHCFDLSKVSQSSFSLDQEEDDIIPVAEAKEDPNVEVKIRVVWKGSSTRHFTVRKFQKIKEIYSYYAALEGIDEDRVLFTLRDKTITPNDTPFALNVGVSSLEGGIVDLANVKSHPAQNADDQSQEDPNSLKLSIQQRGVKEKHTVYTYPHEKISVLISKLSEDLKIPYASIKLMFDGEQLSADSTPNDYDIEGDECIDLIVK